MRLKPFYKELIEFSYYFLYSVVKSFVELIKQVIKPSFIIPVTLAFLLYRMANNPLTQIFLVGIVFVLILLRIEFRKKEHIHFSRERLYSRLGVKNPFSRKKRGGS